MITHSQLFFQLCFSMTHVWGGGGMCSGLSQPPPHLPALAEDTSLSGCLWSPLEAVTYALRSPQGARHRSPWLHWRFTQLGQLRLTQDKKHSCDPCSRRSWRGHGQRSYSRALEGRSLQLAQPCCSLTPDLFLRSSFGLERARCVIWP